VSVTEGTTDSFRSPLIELDLPISVIRLSTAFAAGIHVRERGKRSHRHNTKLTEDVLPREAACPGGTYLAATDQEAADTMVDKAIEFGAPSEDSPIAEVSRPSAQRAVEGGHHISKRQ
jgi:hypothetical protein